MIQRIIPGSDENYAILYKWPLLTHHISAMYQNPHRFRKHMTSLPAQRLLFLNGVCQLNSYCSPASFTAHSHHHHKLWKPFKIITVYIPLPSNHLNTFYKNSPKIFSLFIFFLSLQTLDPPATFSQMAPRVVYAYNPPEGVVEQCCCSSQVFPMLQPTRSFKILKPTCVPVD